MNTCDNIRLIARGSMSDWSGARRPRRMRLQYPTRRWLLRCFMVLRSCPMSLFASEVPAAERDSSRSRASPRGSAAPGAATRPAEQRKSAGFEDGRQQKPCGETAHMRPPRDAGLLRIAERCTEELQHEPEAHDPEGAEPEGIEDDAERNDDRDPYPWKKQNVRREHAGNGTRRAHHGNARCGIDEGERSEER